MFKVALQTMAQQAHQCQAFLGRSLRPAHTTLSPLQQTAMAGRPPSTHMYQASKASPGTTTTTAGDFVDVTLVAKPQCSDLELP